MLKLRCFGAFLVLLSLTEIVTCRQALAGAWTQEKDNFYLRFSATRFSSGAFYAQDRNRTSYAEGGKHRDWSVYGYLEYGFGPQVTLVAVLPYKSLQYRSASLERRTNGIGDVYGGLRYLLSDAGLVSSLQAGFKLNPGYQTNLEELDGAPPLGDGQTDFELHLLLGKSFLGYAAYYNIDLGYRARQGEPVDEIPFAFELGLNLGPAALIIGQIYGARALSEAEPAVLIPESQVNLNPVEDVAKAQGQFIIRLTRHVDVAVTYEEVVYGRNTSAGSSWGLAVAVRGTAR